MEPTFVAWLACGLLTALVASGRGRPFLGWFLLGLALGFLGLGAAVFLPPVERERGARTGQGGSRGSPTL